MPSSEFDKLVAKYRCETQLEPTLRRLRKAEAFLKRTGLKASQVRFENHSDPMWPTRKVRTPLERLAVEVGYTNARVKGGNHSRWFIVPKVRPKKGAGSEKSTTAKKVA